MTYPSLFLLICFWMNSNGQHITTGNEDPRFIIYKECMADSIAPWQLLGQHSNTFDYEKYNFQPNKVLSKVHPIAIFTPTSSINVQVAVKCGVRTNLQLVPISGGHSYAGLSYGTNDSIIIDFRYMNKIFIDEEKMTVSCGSGTFLGVLYLKLSEKKLGASLGACSTVAIGGFVLGGGIGYFSSYKGLLIDNLVEINMVDASGNAVVVRENHNEDLWWAMRGVGPGYIGLITDVKFKVFKTDDLNLTFIRVRFENKYFKNVMGNFFKWLDWVKENDPSINSVITVRSGTADEKCARSGARPDAIGTELQILRVEDPKMKKMRIVDIVDVVLTYFPNRDKVIIGFPSFINFVHKVSFTPVEHYRITMPNREKLKLFSSFTREKANYTYYKGKSFYVKKSYKAESFIEAEKALQNITTSIGIIISSEQGAIGQRQVNESAYVHRDALFNFKVYVDSDKEEEFKRSEKWMDKFYKLVSFMDSGETFQNYPEHEMKDYLSRFYGTNLERLVKIKKKWDPSGYFNSTMSIPIN